MLTLAIEAPSGHPRMTYSGNKSTGLGYSDAARCLPLIEKTVARGALGAPATAIYYQLAFFTPGIRPFDAISRN